MQITITYQSSITRTPIKKHNHERHALRDCSGSRARSDSLVQAQTISSLRFGPHKADVHRTSCALTLPSCKKSRRTTGIITTSHSPASLVLPSAQMCPYQVVLYSILKSVSHCLPLSCVSMPPNTSLTAKPSYNGCISSLSLLSYRLPYSQTDAAYICHNEK